jgi:hypothetical protein
LKVNIQDVTVSTVTKGRNSYQVAEVVYSNDRGENKTKKIMSFSNPAVFAVVSKGAKGWHDTESDGAPYYNWTSIKPAGGDDQQAAPAAAKSGVVKSTYETAEERKVKQLYIIRQSSISNAIDYLKAVHKEDEPAWNVNDVLNVAQEFVDFVYGTEEALASMDSED